MCDDPIVANTKRRPLWRPAVRQRVLEACLGKPRLDSHLRGLVATCEACEPSRASLHGRWARGGNGPLTHHRARDDKRGGAEQHSLYRRLHCQPAPPSPRPPRPPAGGGPVLAVPLQELALDESWGGVNVTYLSWGGVNLTRCTQLPLSREAKATCFGVGAGSTGLPTPDMGTKVHRIPCCSSDFRGFVPAGSPSLSTMRGKTSGGPHAMGSMCDWSSNYTPGAATAATSYRAATPICRWAFMRQPGTLHSGSRRDGPV